jgi:predicted nucleotidyltransferase
MLCATMNDEKKRERAEKIRELLLFLRPDIKYKEIAEDVGVTPSTISGLMKSKDASDTTLNKLEDWLKQKGYWTESDRPLQRSPIDSEWKYLSKRLSALAEYVVSDSIDDDSKISELRLFIDGFLKHSKKARLLFEDPSDDI